MVCAAAADDMWVASSSISSSLRVMEGAVAGAALQQLHSCTQVLSSQRGRTVGRGSRHEKHFPVMFREVTEALLPALKGNAVLDMTLGAGTIAVLCDRVCVHVRASTDRVHLVFCCCSRLARWTCNRAAEDRPRSPLDLIGCGRSCCVVGAGFAPIRHGTAPPTSCACAEPYMCVC